MEKTSKKKKTVIIAASVVLLACLCVGIGVGAASCNPNFYSTEQHIARISARVQERFINTGAHESFTVSPLYNQNDEVNQFLVEFNDDGYLYVQTHLVYPVWYEHVHHQLRERIYSLCSCKGGSGLAE